MIGIVSAALSIVTPMPLTRADVRFVDRSLAAEGDVAVAGMPVLRGAPNVAELWDEAQKTWRPAPAEEALKQTKQPVFKPGKVLAGVLVASGEIRLTPVASGRVVIDGHAETNRLLYVPVGGRAKHWLS